MGGGKPRFVPNGDSFDLSSNSVFTVGNLMQIAAHVRYVDPLLANNMAGMILGNEEFLNYMAPPTDVALNAHQHSFCAERHIIDVAEEIRKESNENVLKSDVLVLGHHGSFTSSSIGFVNAVDPNVALISADDQSYSGASLPDFSTVFWNLNTLDKSPTSFVKTAFVHSDARWVAEKRKQSPDTLKTGSITAGEIMARRRRDPLPIWRTDWNDDAVDANRLVDNIEIISNGTGVWRWTRDADQVTANYKSAAAQGPVLYWQDDNFSKNQPNQPMLRPIDPTGAMRSFATE